MTTADIKDPTHQIIRRLRRMKHINDEIKTLRDKESLMQYEILSTIRARKTP